MTIEEALDMAKIPLDCPDADEKVKEFARLCITALEKQTLKKPIEIGNLTVDIQVGAGIFRKGTNVLKKCPNCEKPIVPHIYSFCGYCGQKIDWSEEE